MGYLINTHEHSQGHSNVLVFLLGAIFNIFANTTFSNLLDYTLKALIGGLVWLIYKLLADYISSRAKRKSNPSEKNKGKDH